MIPEAGLVFALPPERRLVGAPRRDANLRSRERSLSDDDISATRSLANTKSLRSLGADFGVSPETVLSVLRRGDSQNRTRAAS